MKMESKIIKTYILSERRILTIDSDYDIIISDDKDNMKVVRKDQFCPPGAYGRIRVRDPDHHTRSRNELGASEEGGPESGMADQNPRSRPSHLFSNDRVH